MMLATKSVPFVKYASENNAWNMCYVSEGKDWADASEPVGTGFIDLATIDVDTNTQAPTESFDGDGGDSQDVDSQQESQEPWPDTDSESDEYWDMRRKTPTREYESPRSVVSADRIPSVGRLPNMPVGASGSASAMPNMYPGASASVSSMPSNMSVGTSGSMNSMPGMATGASGSMNAMPNMQTQVMMPVWNAPGFVGGYQMCMPPVQQQRQALPAQAQVSHPPQTPAQAPRNISNKANISNAAGEPPSQGNASKKTSSRHTKIAKAIATVDQPASMTTVLVRNLPKGLKQVEFVKELDESGFVDTYDFCYLPCDFATGQCRGYAFVNSLNTQDAVRLKRSWQGSRRFCFNPTDLPLEMKDAHVQGFEANYVMAQVGKIRNAGFRPLVLHRGPPDAKDSSEQAAEKPEGAQKEPAKGASAGKGVGRSNGQRRGSGAEQKGRQDRRKAEAPCAAPAQQFAAPHGNFQQPQSQFHQQDMQRQQYGNMQQQQWGYMRGFPLPAQHAGMISQ